MRWEKAATLTTLHSWEDVPESQSLITSPSHNILAVRRYAKIKYAKSVSSECRQFGHCREFPSDDLV